MDLAANGLNLEQRAVEARMRLQREFAQLTQDLEAVRTFHAYNRDTDIERVVQNWPYDGPFAQLHFSHTFRTLLLHHVQLITSIEELHKQAAVVREAMIVLGEVEAELNRLRFDDLTE